MTHKDMKQYRYLKKEAKRLSKRLEKMQNGYEHIAVKGSDIKKPYQMKVTTVAGPGNSLDAYKRTLALLEHRAENVKADIERIEEFISSIPDSCLRQLIEDVYCNGYTWLMAAHRVYGEPCRDRARKAVSRYFEKISK